MVARRRSPSPYWDDEPSGKDMVLYNPHRSVRAIDIGLPEERPRSEHRRYESRSRRLSASPPRSRRDDTIYTNDRNESPSRYSDDERHTRDPTGQSARHNRGRSPRGGYHGISSDDESVYEEIIERRGAATRRPASSLHRSRSRERNRPAPSARQGQVRNDPASTITLEAARRIGLETQRSKDVQELRLELDKLKTTRVEAERKADIYKASDLAYYVIPDDVTQRIKSLKEDLAKRDREDARARGRPSGYAVPVRDYVRYSEQDPDVPSSNNVYSRPRTLGEYEAQIMSVETERDEVRDLSTYGRYVPFCGPSIPSQVRRGSPYGSGVHQEVILGSASRRPIRTSEEHGCHAESSSMGQHAPFVTEVEARQAGEEDMRSPEEVIRDQLAICFITSLY